jgi:uncharacterized protein
MITKQERNWALAAHLAGPVGTLASAGLLGFLVPLVIWLVQRDESAFVGDQAKEALNFQITIFLVFVMLVLLAIVTLGVGLIIAVPAFLVLWVLQVVLGILAGIRSYEGVYYRYPFSLRLVP